MHPDLASFQGGEGEEKKRLVYTVCAYQEEVATVFVRVRMYTGDIMDLPR